MKESTIRTRMMLYLFNISAVVVVFMDVFIGGDRGLARAFLLALLLICLIIQSLLYIPLYRWGWQFNHYCMQNKYAELLDEAKRQLRKRPRMLIYQYYYALALLYAGNVSGFMAYSEVLLTDKKFKQVYGDLISIVIFRNAILFLRGEYASIVSIDRFSLENIKCSKRSYHMQMMISGFLSSQYDDVLAHAERLQCPMMFYACIVDVMLCEIYSNRGVEVKAEFYEWEALTSATSSELHDLIAQRLSGAMMLATR